MGLLKGPTKDDVAFELKVGTEADVEDGGIAVVAVFRKWNSLVINLRDSPYARSLAERDLRERLCLGTLLTALTFHKVLKPSIFTIKLSIRLSFCTNVEFCPDSSVAHTET